MVMTGMTSLGEEWLLRLMHARQAVKRRNESSELSD